MKNNENSLLKAAWLIAFVTIISKFVGFLRDICVANYYGAGMVSDAYFYAYQIPSLAIILMGGVGGPFHSATVSVFAKMGNNFITYNFFADYFILYKVKNFQRI